MQNLCHIVLGCLFCRSALLVQPSAHFQPTQLNLTEGETATFTCFISSTGLGYNLYWYKKENDRQSVKLDCSSPKYRVSQRDAQTYEIEIRDLEKNDSGTYFCWLINFSSNETIVESNQANLLVTAAAVQPPEITRVKEKSDGDGSGTNIPLAAIRGSGLFLLLVVLYFIVLNIRRRRQEPQTQKDRNAPLGEDPPAVTVFTVDYEMLEFSRTKKSGAASLEVLQQEQTEYATVVFFPKTSAAAEAEDSKPMSCPACVQQP